MGNLWLFGALGVGAYLVFGNKAQAAVQGPSPGASGDSAAPAPTSGLYVLMTDENSGTVLLSDGRTMTREAWIKILRRAM